MPSGIPIDCSPASRVSESAPVGRIRHVNALHGFYSKVIAATAHEAPHILDGLLLHETGLGIEQPTTDTGGFTEIVFALCALLGFRFVPRIRNLPTTRLYTFEHPKIWPKLHSVIGGRLHEKRVIAGWPDILRLMAQSAPEPSCPRTSSRNSP
jgi:TnpA family transposase